AVSGCSDQSSRSRCRSIVEDCGGRNGPRLQEDRRLQQMGGEKCGLILVGILLVASCSAAGADSWADHETLSAIEATLHPGELEQLRDLVDPLAVTDHPEDLKITPVRVEAGDPVLGIPEAPVTIVVFSDYQCPFCSRHEETIAKVKEAFGDRVRVVFKQFPLQFHKEARPAAIAAIAAGRQGRFWEMHYKIFGNARSLSRENYFTWAGELGLDLGDFETALASEEVAAQVDRDIAAGGTYNVRGTPATFINGVSISGAQPYTKLEELVLLGLKRAYVLLRKGVPADDVYDTLVSLQPSPDGGASKPKAGRPGFLHKDWN
ncbi:MAG: thioredoxin domain-containing protein, partial [Pseudomonadota bacterium]